MMRTLLAATICLSTAASALAHSPLKMTVPADGAELASPPKTITMQFGKSARLTKVTVKQEKASDPVRLDLPTKSFARAFEMDGIPKAAGSYLVRWRALGKDGHVLKGSFGYTVAPR
ncbi:copper resistance CopC family protein [Ahrensia sp. R2A130]|uniref:copper resistance CopC family protein n=1 Tax=Ahrensia sp. R2A130 TaxID=744979 RepID=UPI0001E0E849|nr:copper resistance CopC family protein [Ahrensia sp. R2A130]EFL90933.1 copper resistance protein CopC [Ahrensia sp. R2A130]